MTDNAASPVSGGLRLTVAEVESILTEHDAAEQGHEYGRCDLCSFTRHPCDVYVLAWEWLQLRRAVGEQTEQVRRWRNRAGHLRRKLTRLRNATRPENPPPSPSSGVAP
jgi:hypothetical protein